MKAFAYYKLPGHGEFTFVEQTEGELHTVNSCSNLGEGAGFVVVPFAVSDDTPAVVIRPDRVECTRLEPFVGDNGGACGCLAGGGTDEERMRYGRDFRKFHEELLSGRFSKIVLSRRSDITADVRETPETLFFRACGMFPHAFVALVSTPLTGTWLAATPEILIERQGESWRTMALAGTMPITKSCLDAANGQGRTAVSDIGSVWGIKNIEEQRYVAAYIAESLAGFTDDYRASGPYTVCAGNVMHLRTDFVFTLPDTDCLGRLVGALHPTPAVCGLPKAETYSFIQTGESCPRRYYSGFMGPLGIAGITKLYVSLRCMEISKESYHLYAGGGLLPDSLEQQEWMETEAKMEAMRRVIYGGRQDNKNNNV